MVDRSRRRLWIINTALIVLVLLVLVGVVVGLTASSSSGAETSRRTVPVGRGTVTETVTASGTVGSAETSTLNFASGGTVASVSVALGDRVRRGQTVATLDGDSARANLTAARAQLTAARQQLSDAIDARDAADTTAATPAPATPAPAGSTPAGSTPAAGSATSTGGSDASVDSARASVRQAEAQVVTARQSTSDLTLEAPQDGTVVTLDARVGQTVGGGGVVTSGGSTAPGSTGASSGTSSGTSSGGSAPGGSASGGAAAGGSSGATGAVSGAAGAATAGGSSLMTVADLDSLEVQADVPELDVGRVNNGLPATVTVNALPGDTIPGSVSAVDVLPGAATGTGSSVQYGTTVDVDQPPPGLRPGMSATVSIVVRSATDTTFLPAVAVTPIGGAGATAATVNVLGRDGQVTARTVGIGLTSDTTTQITSGLAPGELAVLPDAAAVDPNQFRGGPRNQQGGGG